MKKLVLALTAAILVVVSAVGCSDKSVTPDETSQSISIPEYQYTAEHYRIEDLFAKTWLINGSLEVTCVDGVTYSFDSSVSLDKRTEFIKTQQRINDYLAENKINTSGFEVVVLNGVVSRAVSSEKTVYIDYTLCDTTDHILLTLQTILGEYTNYGYMYALSRYIMNEINGTELEHSEVDDSVFEETPILLNLVYPCFDEKYFAVEQIQGCISLSHKLLSEMTNPFGGEDVFMQKASEYAALNSIQFTPTYLTFAFGGTACPLKIKTKYLDISLDIDYKGSCTLTEKSIAEDPMFCFENMLSFWEYADSDIAEVRDVCGFDNESLIVTHITPIERTISGGGDTAGYFAPSRILLESIYTVTHEYTHYIDYMLDGDDGDDISWCGESLACYFGKNMQYYERLVRGNSGYENVYTVDILSKAIGQPYDSVEDEILFMCIMNAREDNYRYNLISAYTGRMVFGHYFVGKYGVQAFVDCMLDPSTAQETVGCDIDTIVGGWCEWLGQYSTEE